jgi:hypothetical protein
LNELTDRRKPDVTHLDDTAYDVAENTERERQQLEQRDREDLLRRKRCLARDCNGAEGSEGDEERRGRPKEEREGVEDSDFPQHPELSVISDESGDGSMSALCTPIAWDHSLSNSFWLKASSHPYS